MVEWSNALWHLAVPGLGFWNRSKSLALLVAGLWLVAHATAYVGGILSDATAGPCFMLVLVLLLTKPLAMLFEVRIHARRKATPQDSLQKTARCLVVNYFLPFGGFIQYFPRKLLAASGWFAIVVVTVGTVELATGYSTYAIVLALRWISVLLALAISAAGSRRNTVVPGIAALLTGSLFAFFYISPFSPIELGVAVGRSMNPSIEIGDILIVKKVPAEELEVGRIAAFHNGTNNHYPMGSWAKRVRAMPGDELLSDGMYLKAPPGTLIVLGDNSEASWDSRYFGPVPFQFVTGYVVGVIPSQLCWFTRNRTIGSRGSVGNGT